MQQWIEVSIRSLGMLILLFSITKVLGKKQLAHLSYFDYITGVVLGGIVAVTCIDPNIPVMFSIISIAIFSVVTYLFDFLALKSKAFRDFVDGKGTVLIKDGKILEDNMKKQQLTSDMLLKQLRTKNAFKAADVEFAVLEPTGEINVLMKKDYQPITLKDLNIKPPEQKEPETVIMDGEILDEPLATLGLSRGWLKTELDKIGVAIENVFLAQVDSDAQLTVDLFDDKLQVPKPTEKPLMLATIKKCYADLEGFALQTESEDAKQMYKKSAQKVSEAISKLEKYLQ